MVSPATAMQKQLFCTGRDPSGYRLKFGANTYPYAIGAVGRGPGAAAAVPARPRRRPEVSPPPPTVRWRRSDRSTTSPRPQNAAQRHVSPSAAHSPAFRPVSRILVTTSGESILLPVGGQHSKLNRGRRLHTRYSDSDIPPSFSRTFSAFRTFRVQNGG